MARSTYIYVVTDRLGVVAAFTVKHELATWLRSLRVDSAARHRVTRLPDGVHSYTTPTTLDITELLA